MNEDRTEDVLFRVAFCIIFVEGYENRNGSKW